MRSLVMLAVLLCCITFVMADAGHDKKWEEWKQQHGVTYGSDAEHNERKQIHKKHSKTIDDHNKLAAQGMKNFTMKMNHLGDRKAHEVKGLRGHRSRKNKGSSRTFSPLLDRAAPSTMDWRHKGAVTPVKMQGYVCGSCWTFATTGVLEGQNFLKTGTLVSLSEQNVLDCSSNDQYGNGGCDGGNAASALQYVQDNGGIDTESSYPYNAVQGTCSYNSANKGGSDTGLVEVTSGDEAALMQAVGTVGPIAIAVDANHDSFQFYGGGVFTEPACSSSDLDHAVLVVGYDHDPITGLNYWIVKNSWDTTWGDQGYAWIAKDDNNMCGVATEAIYPTV